MTTRRVDPEQHPGRTTRTIFAAVAATALIVAAVVHLLVVPEHLREWRPAGVFFALVTLLQLVSAAAVLRSRHPALLLAVLGTTVGLIALYVWSRTLGLPFMPDHASGHAGLAGHNNHAVGGRGNGIPAFPGAEPEGVEAVATIDLVSLVSELVVVASVLGLLSTVGRRRATNALLGCAVALVAARGFVQA